LHPPKAGLTLPVMDTASALCLDLTRLVRRARQPTWTGIDRVELAYLGYVIARAESPGFGLVRCGGRFALLDRAGLRTLADRIDAGGPWDRPGLTARLSRPNWAAVEATVASLALATVPLARLGDLLAACVPSGTTYLNVGHTNLDPGVFAALQAIPSARSIVLVHDTIPLDHPDMQRDGTVETFRARFHAATRHASRIVVPSHSVASDVARHAGEVGRTPPFVVAPIGVGPLHATTPPEGYEECPYFVCLGTIEPRKNHALLLDLWEELHRTLPDDRVPRLYIVGRRGWKNRDVFRRLDSLPFMGRTVVELADLPDGPLAALIAGAAGLLQPSRAEGFGLPPHEALTLGTTAVCAPLPVYRETLGDAAIYADADDLCQWRNAVLRLLEAGGTGEEQTRGEAGLRYTAPTWEAHFKTALTPFC
jgi:glycosyltransferase involved in cell wall biosynthesis